MNAEADKLRAEITAADKRISDLEKRPGLTATVKHQIEKAKDVVRDMRIKLAGMQDHRDIPYPNCRELMPHSFFICRPCMLEVPFKLYVRLVGARGFHHHGLISDAALAETHQAVLSHLRQHSTAIL
ncbi:MAG: hypothetical protein WAW39_15930 [Prosthecobacter sp.]|uniref:hypothetical protein n=1 Tax=Prosthecobacter sp. TaxID=1965333 RepID=UPI003BAFDC9D